MEIKKYLYMIILIILVLACNTSPQTAKCQEECDLKSTLCLIGIGGNGQPANALSAYLLCTDYHDLCHRRCLRRSSSSSSN